MDSHPNTKQACMGADWRPEASRGSDQVCARVQVGVQIYFPEEVEDLDVKLWDVQPSLREEVQPAAHLLLSSQNGAINVHSPGVLLEDLAIAKGSQREFCV